LKVRAPKTTTLAILAALLAGGSGAVGSGARRVGGHVPRTLMAQSTHVGRHSGAAPVGLAISLRLHDTAGLDDLLKGLYDPSDYRFRQFLTPAEFRQRFAPSDAEVATVADSLRARGLTVVKTHDSNLLLEVVADSATVEQAFQVELHDYRTSDGRVAYAPSTEPLVQGEGADLVAAVNGLSTLVKRTTHIRKPAAGSVTPHAATPDLTMMTPSKIRTAYNLTGVASTGTGETLALMELDGYDPTDIAAYASQFSITAPPLQNVLLAFAGSTAPGTAGVDTAEVCLDIEVAMALAPGLAKIKVYEAVNSEAAMINAFSQISADATVKEVSTSWGYPESLLSSSTLESENTIFAQMAAQGQSVFAAAGDSGAYDNTATPTVLNVDDPASQPNVTGVGGTTLTSNAGSGAYISEASWGTAGYGGGGGISGHWSLPSWQSGLGTAANYGNGTSHRMVPDVSLNANPNTGYPIYVGGAWLTVGGTSAAAPLWAAFSAIVNQGLVAAGSSRAGFMNPVLYQLGASVSAATVFHDVADNSTNLYYKAVAGYDLSTGLGTINGLNLYNALMGPPAPATVTVVTNTGSLDLTWTAATGATSYSVYRATTSGGAYASVATGLAATAYSDSGASGVQFYYVTTVIGGTEGTGSRIRQAPPTAPSSLTGAVQ
jgi:subtilase family serine protease